jgi:hypothetical protein
MNNNDKIKELKKYQKEAELDEVLKSAATAIAFGGDGSEKRMRRFLQLLEGEITAAAGDMSGDHARVALINVRKMIKTRLNKGVWRPIFEK